MKKHIVRGSMWAIGLRWTLKFSGLASTVLLARLLTPADFGIVSIAILCMGIVDVFGQTGQHNALIRLPHPTREHYDSVWTVTLLLQFVLGLIILATASITTAYFHEPRAIPIVQIFAFRTMLVGFENVGIVNFRRDLRFHRQFQYNFYPNIISVLVTVISAFALRNYWALVYGALAKQVATIALSYALDSFRPRLSLAKVKEIWSFSTWTLIRSVGVYLNAQIDKVAIGGYAGAAGMGRYGVASDLGVSPTQELNDPMIAVLFPVMSKVQHDKEKRRELFLSVLYWSALICISTSVGVALVTRDMVDLVLGPKWNDVKPLMPWLALSFGILGLSSGVYPALDTIGRAAVSARLQWMRLFCACLCMFPAAYFFRDLRAVAIARFLVTLALTPTLFYALAKALEFPMRDFAVTLWRPLAAGLMMAVVVLGLNAAINFGGPPRLMLDVTFGGVSFVVALMTLWFLTGRPPGPEQYLWERTGPWLRIQERHRVPSELIVTVPRSQTYRPQARIKR